MTAAPQASADRPLLGILLMLGFCMAAPLGDAMAKVLGETNGTVLLVLVRFGVQALALVPLVALLRGTGGMARLIGDARLFRLTMLRALLHIGGLGFMFSALRYLPVADAIAIAFVLPFLMLIFGKLFLGEEVGPHRIAACAIGFVGVLLVLRPNFAEVGAPALLPLGVAVVFGAFILVTRHVAAAVDPLELQAVNGVQATLILVIALPFLPGEVRGSLAIDPAELPLLAVFGLFGSFAHVLMTWSLKFAPTATLAPMQYLEIPFATLVGWWIFRDLPDGLAALGIAVTMAAGLYIIARERAIGARTRRGDPRRQ